MKSSVSKGIICLKDELNIEFRVCVIEYILNEDETFEYRFYPNYDVISLLSDNLFQGIPGLNLDLKKEVYIRKNILPVFISERVPSKNREDYSYVCNDKHLLCLKHTCDNEKINEELNISIPEFIKLPYYLQREYNQYIVPIKQFYREQKELKLNPYWLGVWLGDGSSKKPEITTMDKEIIETCYEIADYYHLNVHVYTKPNNKASSYSMVKIKGKINGFSKVLRELDVWGNKHIPDEYLFSSYENRMKLLCGLLDTDGGKEKQYVLSISQERKLLSEQIVFLARSLGFKTTMRPKVVKGKTYYRINILGETWKIPLRVKHKIVEEHYSQRPYTIGTYFEDLGIGYYYGFQVEGDGKFLLDNCLVVHNSSIINAIAWTLVGETTSGITTNVVNMFGDGGCKCVLDFNIDNHSYKIIRTREDKEFGNNLFLYIDEENKSGKGLKETQAILSQILPDITIEFLSSVILLSQGLPYKFTNNTPSGRKNLLEKLSKSDYMINDLTSRVTSRMTSLNLEKRKAEDNKLKIESEKNINENNLKQKEQDKEELLKQNNGDILQETTQISKELDDLDKYINENTNLLNEQIKAKDELSKKQNDIYVNGTIKINEEQSKIDKLINEQQTKKIELSSSIKSLGSEITTLDNVKTICPTCGQPLKGVVKKDTIPLKEKLSNLKDELKSIEEEIYRLNIDKTNISSKILSECKEECKNIVNDINTLNTNIQNINNSLTEKQNAKVELNKKLTILTNFKQNLDNLNKEIEKIKKDIVDNDKKIKYNIEIIDRLSNQLSVVKKMETTLKRDFRGFLLINIINYINVKAKEYCKDVFNTELLDIKLEGNNISIYYDNKPYENLSGGEKAKLDVIIQLALRNMLTQYLDFSCNCIFIDEIFDMMDSIGVQKILNLITTKLNDVESIYIISHHQDLNIPYDYELIVEKNEKGMSTIK